VSNAAVCFTAIAAAGLAALRSCTKRAAASALLARRDCHCTTYNLSAGVCTSRGTPRPYYHLFECRLLVALASDPVTAAPTLQLLRSQCGGLAALVPSVVCAPLPEQVQRSMLG
jgi:hypothetical protein